MRFFAISGSLFCVAISYLAAPAFADAPPSSSPNATWGAHLLSLASTGHPEIEAAAICASETAGSPSAIVAAFGTNPPACGDSPTTDTTVLKAPGAPLITRGPLVDVSAAPLGTIVLALDPARVSRESAARAIAERVRAFVAKHIISVANVRDPYPYTSYPTQTRAQQIVDALLARHPELIVLGMHVTLPTGPNVMLASNIGRIGKPADDDDTRVFKTGSVNHEVASNGLRYEVELVLEDREKRNIGALGVVLPYHAAADKPRLDAQATAIRDELARAIPDVATLLAPASANAAALAPAGTTALVGYKGDFDHLAYDLARKRLYLAGEDGAEVYAFDLTSGSIVHRIVGLGVPHSLLVMPRRREVLVLDGGKPSPIFDAQTLRRKRSLTLPAGADSVDYDASTGRLWVVTGGKDVGQRSSALIEIDPADGRIFHRVPFASNHVEALAVEQHGDRLYINLTSEHEIAVVDKRSGKVIARWRVPGPGMNSPIALDEASDRLFVVTRKPGRMLVMSGRTGNVVAQFAAPEGADQVVWDAGNRRVYVPGGAGKIGVYQQLTADRYGVLPRVASTAGAKTAILIPAIKAFFVAASPGSTRVGGALLRFDVAPRS